MKNLKYGLVILLLAFVAFYFFKIKNQKNTFSIIGTVKNYNGMIYLYPAAGSAYYNGFSLDSTAVKDGKFKFEFDFKNGYPLPFYFIVDKEHAYKTDWILLEQKEHFITIDSLYHNLVPFVSNQNPEFLIDQKRLKFEYDMIIQIFRDSIAVLKSLDIPKNDYLKRFSAARERYDKQSKSALVSFTDKFPDSYIALARIAISQTYGGYSEELEKAFNNLSPDLKKSILGVRHQNDLKISKKLSIGGYFPELALKTLDLGKINLNLKENTTSKFTLIDFWFSYCGPCLKQFPDLKELHREYNSKNIEIIGISTDVSSKIEEWRGVVQKHELPWTNLLDENGNLSSVMGVNKFPTNFLLDESGKIIKKDILISDLELLLLAELKE